MSFARIWRLSDLRCLTFRHFRRKLGISERSKGCDSRTSRETDPCSSSKDDEYCPPCPSCPPPWRPSCPPPRCGPSIYYPHVDPRKQAFWRILSLCVALPIVVIMSAVTYARVKEKAKKPREPFQDLPYMYRRTKPFPWGDGNHSFFHNPVMNPIPPHGYEVEDPNAPKKAGN
ncbi:Cytochrome c oxidase subunit 6A1, mitochondrial [Trachymyrmex septentrionalis]|uniref:Cytochrome c oxidase subunit 6A1, mitochondrial n=1 Tax=Trachymyrmex septentrionalis TaxID=34720 RepID=A0A195FIE4_9HYME|nr:PREDICTED: cytochrome c oxidase subunit 6A1, mitochondrial-like [Trachymyrmex septentrionalis]XP_018341103.1 PREDICTED: cytochrome c oxidase subunit 6A1, mitochondrial-like [Trachymyrmex septentrionalis]XP_018341104.1 PREDICTED: cytochrome c oxidase subunit 6A1, mitochondrial-like [Trachymyrmex septentrionalis]KYN40440.1 Cytochrome c oxidase subunit 6A1, mitochondrial [Trachymyrmex septentrionalis]